MEVGNGDGNGAVSGGCMGDGHGDEGIKLLSVGMGREP